MTLEMFFKVPLLPLCVSDVYPARR